jgi:hypothetical protein
MLRTGLDSLFKLARARLAESLTDRRTLHGLPVSILHNSVECERENLWSNLTAALEVIAEFKPIWISRMRVHGVKIRVQSTPGTRAKLLPGPTTVLDCYFVGSHRPAQIASSIVHEATHARIRAAGIPFVRETLAKEERICRRAEFRFGRALLEGGQEGADLVLGRVEPFLTAPDDEIAVFVDPRDLVVLARIQQLKELPVPRRVKRWLARRSGLLATPAGQQAFGEESADREASL